MKKYRSKLNCWNWGHPIRSIKNAYWRITRGFCPSDVWDWYTYEAEHIKATLYYLAAHKVGVPVKYEGNEAMYDAELEKIGSTLVSASNWEDVYDNPFEEAFFKELEKTEHIYLDDGTHKMITHVDENLRKHYTDITKKNFKRAQREVKQSLKWLADNWFDLWD